MIPIVATAISSFGSLVHSSAAGPNAAACAVVLGDAQAGNLAAVQCIGSRATLQTQSSAAPWAAAWEQLDPGLKASAQQAVQAKIIPESWWQLPPEQVVATVRQYSTVKASAAPGVTTATPGASTGLSAAGKIIQQLFGPTAAQAGAAAGQAGAQTAGASLQRTFLLLTVLVVAGVVGFVVLRKKAA